MAKFGVGLRDGVLEAPSATYHLRYDFYTWYNTCEWLFKNHSKGYPLDFDEWREVVRKQCTKCRWGLLKELKGTKCRMEHEEL